MTETATPPNSRSQDEVSLGDSSVELSQFERYKGVKNQTDRIAILSNKLVRGYRYYDQKSKTSFRAPTEPTLLAQVKAALGEPEQRFAFVIFHYHIHPGTFELLDPTKCQGKVKVWNISESRYQELSNMHATWPLLDGGFQAKQVDLQLLCKDEQYQRMTFTPLPTAHWKTKEAWYQALKGKEAKAMDKARLSIGKELDEKEIASLLGLGGGGPAPTAGAPAAGDIDLSDVIEE